MRQVALFDGLLVVLSRFPEDAAARFRHEEADDVVAVALHLKGGARFDMDRTRFSTRPFEVWAGAAPRSSRSAFELPASGFETVALRFSPELAREGRIGGRPLPTPLRALAQTARDAVSAQCLGRASESSAMIARAMLASPFRQGADTQFLEACSHALLAALGEPSSDARDEAAAALAPVKLEHARDLLEERYLEPPTIVALAREVGTNDFTLKRAFKHAYGTTIHGYVRRYRMERAAEALDGGMSVQHAAAAVGYQCPRCFADTFRRTFGVLPSEMTRARIPRTAPARYG